MSVHGMGKGFSWKSERYRSSGGLRDTAVVLGFLLPLERHRHPTTSLTSSLPRFTVWGCSINLRSWSEMLKGRIHRSGGIFPVMRVELRCINDDRDNGKENKRVGFISTNKDLASHNVGLSTSRQFQLPYGQRWG